jgi:hypothetical protein
MQHTLYHSLKHSLKFVITFSIISVIFMFVQKLNPDQGRWIEKLTVWDVCDMEAGTGAGRRAE